MADGPQVSAGVSLAGIRTGFMVSHLLPACVMGTSGDRIVETDCKYRV